MATDVADARPPASRRSLAIGAGAACGALLLVGVFASIGGPQTFVEALGNVIFVLVAAGLVPGLYLAGAVGLGHAFAPLTRGTSDPGAIRAALGLATMLWISSLMGSVHVGVDPVSRAVAAAPIAFGFVLLLLALRERLRRAEPSRVAWSWVAIAPAGALLVAAALNPPGWLWASEFGGYDALSYHLQLPQEWLQLGRVRPLEHNVYSFLPSGVEAAFAHIAVLAGVERPYAPDGAPTGLLTGEGLNALSCQLLHAGLALLSAWLVGRAARMAALKVGATDQAATLAEIAGATLFIATPWVIVTGSLAYNEMGVTAMAAGALLIALDDGLPAIRRGLFAGTLVGVACVCKPTAFFLAGVPLAFVLFGLAPRRSWLLIAGAGCVAGIIALAPWLLRNALASANPVFPYATGIFGAAHWTQEQAERFATHHAFQGSWGERLALLVRADASDPAGVRHRGLLHPQWLGFFPLALLGGVVAITRRPRERLPIMLGAMLLAQLVLWLVTTHVQSRFLLPLSVTGSVLFAIAGAGVMSSAGRGLQPVVGLVVAIGVLMQFVGSIAIFANQRGGSPNARLLAPPSMLAGHGLLDPEAIEASSIATINRSLPPGAGVMLLGDAAPFYVTREATYNTTWDRWPLGVLVGAHPHEPEAWTRGLLALEIDYVLVDQVGLELFLNSGTADPRITRDVVERWLEDPTTRVVRVWPEEGRLLVELIDPEAASD